MSANAKSKRAGFTLVETVISTLILVIGLGVVGLTFNMAMRMISANRSKMTAMHSARDELERLRTLGFNNANLSAGDHTVTRPNYSGSYTVTDESADVKNVAMNVDYWSNMTNGTAQARLTTSLARPLH